MISIILTIHNKEFLIKKVVESVLKFTHLDYELILVFDGCYDNSEIEINKINTKFKKIYTDNVFETKANNEGMKNATGKYFILIQDDMIIDEHNWESRLIKPMMVFDNVFSVGSRDACNVYLENDNIVFKDFANINNSNRNVFSIRDVVNRGPIAFDGDKIKKLNYFDESYAPYTWDDIDICVRAFENYKWICGCYWISYISKLEWGTTRIKNTSLYNNVFKRNENIFYSRHKKFIELKKRTENLIIGE